MPGQRVYLVRLLRHEVEERRGVPPAQGRYPNACHSQLWSNGVQSPPRQPCRSSRETSACLSRFRLLRICVSPPWPSSQRSAFWGLCNFIAHVRRCTLPVGKSSPRGSLSSRTTVLMGRLLHAQTARKPRGAAACLLSPAPARGLTAALELRRSNCSGVRGRYAGGRHLEDRSVPRQPHGHWRPPFFSKSNWVMNWWQGQPRPVPYRPLIARTEPGLPGTTIQGVASRQSHDGRVLLVRPRLSRTHRRRSSMSLWLNATTPGQPRVAGSGAGLAHRAANARSLTRALCQATWHFQGLHRESLGVPCRDISQTGRSALSITRPFRLRRSPDVSRDLAQKGVEQAYFERFLYPWLGPGQICGRPLHRRRITCAGIEWSALVATEPAPTHARVRDCDW